MQDIEFSVVYDNSQKQSGDNSADNDFVKEMVSMMAEYMKFENNNINNIDFKE